ncbi:hypothetical protein G6Z12_13570 [Clostridium perfringens]|uniref:HipA-like C-terminal domain-containing protein n=1 Tax=Clostridium perfringens TaxID=1502 RepID=A0A2X2YB49_CLOPF|nr:hypothetical protein [Clostridium perfringens]MDY2640766.1 hypothetical protein [Ligilactobacillus salivarius]ELC8423358.1 hypothetical protein [Clostridium perfringens]ELC8451620.1 hypothetical protein [Clostridium perfringens]MBI6069337.1 hypothetical protein [Clostridium perfringens]MBI6097546.1 hypothetical protein [Clostridium perfringens]
MKFIELTTDNNRLLSNKLPKPKKNYYTNHKINGELMHKNTLVAKIVDDDLQVINEKMLPSYFKLGGNLRHWLENRCIDMHRRNSRILRKMLSIKTTNEIEVVLFAHAHTLTDNYWIRLSSELDLKYEDIAYSKDLLFNTAISGDTSKWDEFLELSNHLTPELTLGGSFEKGWKLENGEWFLVKAGNNLNNSVELIASELCKYFNFKAVEYFKYNDACVYCKNFTNNLEYDFEPMFDFLGEDDDLELSLDYIYQINENYISDFLDMVFLDALLLNPDRHTNNYGFLRDSNNGEFIGLAPIFDNNLALFATKNEIIDLNIGNSGQIKMFYLPVLEENRYEIPYLDYKDLKNIVKSAYQQFKPQNYSVEFTTDFIWNKYNFIKSNLIK